MKGPSDLGTVDPLPARSVLTELRRAAAAAAATATAAAAATVACQACSGQQLLPLCCLWQRPQSPTPHPPGSLRLLEMCGSEC